MILDPNSAYAVVADFDIAFTEAGITSANTRAIYRVYATLLSYVPGRPINQITSFEAGKGYYIITGSLPLDLTGIIRTGNKVDITLFTGLAQDWYYTSNPITPTQDTTLWVKDAVAGQMYENLRNAAGAAAPGISFTAEEIKAPFLYLVYTASTDSWAKKASDIDTSKIGQVAVSIGAPNTLQMDYDNQKVIFSSAVLLFNNTQTVITQELPYNSISDNTIVFGIKKSDRTPVIMGSTDDTSDLAMVGAFRKDIPGKNKPATVYGSFSIAGEAVAPYLPSYSVDTKAYSVGAASSLNFDFVNNKIVLNGAIIKHNGVSYNITNGELSWSAMASNTILLGIDKSTHLVAWYESTDTSNSFAIIGQMRRDVAGNFKPLQVNGNYQINGEAVVPFRPSLIAQDVATSVGAASSLNFDHTNSQVVLTGALIRYQGVNYTITGTFAYSSVSTGSAILGMDKVAHTVNLYASTDVTSNIAVIAVMRKDIAGSMKPLTVNGNYQVNGGNAAAFTEFTGRSDIAYVVSSKNSFRVDFTNKRVRFISAVVKYKNINYDKTQAIDFSAITQPMIVVGMNVLTKALVAVGVKAGDDVEGIAIIALVRTDTKDVVCNGLYILENEPVNRFIDYTRGNLPFLFNSTFRSQLPLQTVPNNTSLDTLYSYYDALVATYPTMWTRTLMGQDSFANNIYRYDYQYPQAQNATVTASEQPNRMILTTGVHGYEYYAALGIACFLTEMMTSTHPDIIAVRSGVRFTVVPIVTPSGFLASTRKNGNGVDINRNFPLGWLLKDPSAQDYGGAAPLDQPEAQLLDTLLQGATDAFAAIDNHDEASYSTNGYVGWTDSYNIEVRKFNLSFSKWANDYLMREVGVSEATPGLGVYRINTLGTLAMVQGRYYEYGLLPFLTEIDHTITSDPLEKQHLETNIRGALIIAICKKYLNYN